jgi:hypothetical protein
MTTTDEDRADPALHLDTEHGTVLQFSTYSALLEWTVQENAFWRDIAKKTEKARFPLNLVNFQAAIQSLHLIETRIAEYRNAPAERKISGRNRIAAALGDFREKRHLTSDAPAAATMAELADNEPDAAMVAFLRARGGFKTPPDQEQAQLNFSEIKQAVPFLNAWMATERDAIDYKRARLSQEKSLTALRERWQKHLDDEGALSRKKDLSTRQSRARLRHVAINLLRRYRDQTREHERRMKAMESAFSTEMQLRAAEKFWGKKRRTNRARAEAAFKRLCWTGGLGGAAIIAVYYILILLFGAPGSLNIAQSIVFAVPTIIYVWILRIFATEYRTNKNMADDAEEREAMVMTFKALEYEQRVGKEDRLVILNALFRPHGNTGEENVPAPIWEAVIGRAK